MGYGPSRTPEETRKNTITAFGGVIVTILLVFALIAGSVGGCGLFKNWQRGQQRANARNAVQLTSIQVQNQLQYAKVIQAHNAIVQAQAYQRYLESVGIRRSQDEISRTLTPLYIQHEAIQ